MSLHFTPEQEAEVFEHLFAIQSSVERSRKDIAEIRACMDRIIAMKPAVPQEYQE
jgi:predicted metal-dependent HD superfamily phosphohydrolase